MPETGIRSVHVQRPGLQSFLHELLHRHVLQTGPRRPSFLMALCLPDAGVLIHALRKGYVEQPGACA